VYSSKKKPTLFVGSFKYFSEIQICAQGLAVKCCNKLRIAAHEIGDSAGSNPLFWGIID
jgi:hypothetical protein